MKFIAILAVLCFCVQGSLQQCYGQGSVQSFGQGCGPNYCQPWGYQNGGGCGSSANPEILITLYKILFHLTTTTTVAATTAAMTWPTTWATT